MIKNHVTVHTQERGMVVFDKAQFRNSEFLGKVSTFYPQKITIWQNILINI
uniref:Uncharacterized protein n=1 Tax=Arundo donax TaxID=35708 RepID=A0A0A9FDN7_ARUDO